jgi:hypothetical protein
LIWWSHVTNRFKIKTLENNRKNSLELKITKVNYTTFWHGLQIKNVCDRREIQCLMMRNSQLRHHTRSHGLEIKESNLDM